MNSQHHSYQGPHRAELEEPSQRTASGKVTRTLFATESGLAGVQYTCRWIAVTCVQGCFNDAQGFSRLKQVEKR
jgi:hypothetical protein